MIEQLRRWARWLRPGLGLKRWALVLATGILLISGGGGPVRQARPPRKSAPGGSAPTAADALAGAEDRRPGRRDRALYAAPRPEALLREHHRDRHRLRRRRKFRPAAARPGRAAAA